MKLQLGLPWLFKVPMQWAWVRFLVRELDSTHCNLKSPKNLHAATQTQCRQINKLVNKYLPRKSNPVNILAGFFVDIDKLILKLTYKERQRNLDSINNFEKNNKTVPSTLCNSQPVMENHFFGVCV